MRLIKKLRAILRTKFLSLRTSIRGILNQSDLKRWGNIESMHREWDTRTAIIADYIRPNTKVLEFGAGRMVLKNLIPNDCNYTPSDIVDRGYGTIVCDLNKELPRFDHFDYAIFSGVIEYVYDVPRLIGHLHSSIDTILISYATYDNNSNSRRLHGWVNHYSEDQLVDLFDENGYALKHRSGWRNQVIFKFIRRPKTNGAIRKLPDSNHANQVQRGSAGGKN